MKTTLVGIFDDREAARRAVRQLAKAGIKQSDVSVVEGSPEGKGYMKYGGDNLETGESIGDKVANFFDSIFGSDINDDERGIYSEAVRRGSSTVVVNASDAQAERAAAVLNENGAVDIDRRAAQYRASGYKKFDAKAPIYNSKQAAAEWQTFADQKEITLPVIEEQLNVGKRIVQSGGVRIHQRISEVPVEDSVTLREEHITVDRRPVDRAADQADFDAAKTGDFTVTERAEKAVVGKQARIVEEVVVGKNVTESEKTVSDTVRRTDVEVEKTGADKKRDINNRGK